MSCPFNTASFSYTKPSIRPDPLVGTSFNLYDENFTWTAQHVTPSELNQWRQVGDQVVDDFYNEWGAEIKNGADMYDFVQHHLPEFVQSIRQRPQWFNKKQIQEGQRVFLKHSIPGLISIFHYSLLAGYGFQQLNDVLTKTQYLSSSNLQSTYRRLVETTQMIVSACCGDIDDFDKTFADVIRVRFLHGMVRYKIKKTHIKDVPINQEDLLATLLGFSFIMIRCMEDRLQIFLSVEEKQSYLHLWRYVGWLIGIEDKYLIHVSSYEASRNIHESIFYHHYFPTTTSKHLAHHTLMAVYLYRSDPLSYQFNMALTQQLLGPYLSEALDLHQPMVVDRLHLLCIHLFFKMLQWTSWLCTKNFPWLSTFIISSNRKKLKELLRSGLNDQEYHFALNQKYNPSTTKSTPLKNCPCGYYEKKHEHTRFTNDFGIFRGDVTFLSLNWKSVAIVFLMLFFTFWWWMLKS